MGFFCEITLKSWWCGVPTVNSLNVALMAATLDSNSRIRVLATALDYAFAIGSCVVFGCQTNYQRNDAVCCWSLWTIADGRCSVVVEQSSMISLDLPIRMGCIFCVWLAVAMPALEYYCMRFRCRHCRGHGQRFQSSTPTRWCDWHFVAALALRTYSADALDSLLR